MLFKLTHTLVIVRACVAVICSCVCAARSLVEAAPTWLSPSGSSSSILVLQGEELLLECIAAGMYVGFLLSKMIVSSSGAPEIMSKNVCVPRPTPHITWTKDGENLVVTSRMKVKNFNKLIQIPKAAFEDAGEYICKATNKIGYIQHTITVRVKGKPAFVRFCLLTQLSNMVYY